MLEHIFGSKTRVKLLQLFFRHGERVFFVREIARTAEMQLNAVRREIANLELLGIIVKSDAGAQLEKTGTERSKYYKLNTACLLYPELKALLLKAQMLDEQEFVTQLKTKSGQVEYLLMTGYFTGVTDVDTDLLIVGKIKPMTVERIIKDYESGTGTPIRYTIMESKEFAERREIGDKFLYSVMEAKHITVIDNFFIG